MTEPTQPAELPLRLLFWESTARCNLACRHCRRLDMDDAEGGVLTTAEAERMIDQAADLGRPIIVFSGGEPLLRDDWERLARHAAGRGLPTALATNGTLVDDAVARRIAAAGFQRVSVSLDGPDAPTHDAIRGAAAFDAAMAGIVALRAAGVSVQINTTVTAGNFDRLDRMEALAVSVGAVALHLFVLVPVGCGLELSERDRLSPEQCEGVLEWVVARQAAGAIELKATCAPQVARIARQWLASHGSTGSPPSRHEPGSDRVRAGLRGKGCLAGTGVIFVAHDGEVFPCGYLPASCGNLRRGDLREIWRGSEVLLRLRETERLTGNCGRCEYARVCGGCRARAFAETGDFLAGEPMCLYNR